MADETKKGRPNFTKEESLLLAELVAANRVVLEGRLGPGITCMKRQEAWQRTRDELGKNWKNLKSSSKETYSKFRQQTIATGGGPPTPVSPVTDAVVEAIGRDNLSLTGISDSYDSTALQLLDDITSRERYMRYTF
ncbi:uncharacterized protein LOC124269576 [Haliotis rubra]|uniref:uncharacterized protein LOC124269576 n=1 Tax=Haliotis rubra TaxID=36100 RepID=UPI001EE5652C|nr:uncharacterized protein LOC124269576 [Haliotis rubra]